MLVLTPDVGIPLSDDSPVVELVDMFNAAAGTTALLAGYGLCLDETASSDDIAAKIVTAYAEDPEKTTKIVTDTRIAELPPAAIQQVHALLSQFYHPVAAQAVKIRELVVNKLILETDNLDPRIRLRALELLGKISDVGLFSEKSEVTITHRTTEDIRQQLRERLTRLTRPAVLIEDATVVAEVPEAPVQENPHAG